MTYTLFTRMERMNLWNNYWFRITLWTFSFHLIAKLLVGLCGISPTWVMWSKVIPTMVCSRGESLKLQINQMKLFNAHYQ